MQTTMDDLRTRMAAAAAAEQAEQATPASDTSDARPRKPQLPRPGRAVREFETASEGQRDLIRTMVGERFAADEVQAEFSAFGGDTMTPAQFKRAFATLKGIEQLAKRVAKAAPAAPAPVALQGDIPEGRFTVTFEDGSYRTLRVQRQDTSASFMPGRLLIGYLSGSDNTSNYTNFAHVTERGTVVIWKKHRENTPLAEAVKVLAGDPKAAAQAYFEKTGNCVACGTEISRSDSLENAKTNGGLGPDCAKKYGW